MRDARAQKQLIEFLRTDLELAQIFVDSARQQLKMGELEDYGKLLGQTAKAINTVHYFGDRISDQNIRDTRSSVITQNARDILLLFALDGKRLSIDRGNAKAGCGRIRLRRTRLSALRPEPLWVSAFPFRSLARVQSALKPRCIACSNCVLACPFGIPKLVVEQELMMKCDMCYDRTSIGKKPMCATVCPSQALTYARPEDIARTRREKPVNTFLFGEERVKTKVFMMTPPGNDEVVLDVTDYMWEGESK